MLPGFSVSPGLLTSTPSAFRDVQREFFRRIAELPFVPADWSSSARQQIDAAPMDYYHILPVFSDDGTKYPGPFPEFLDTEEKLRAWDMIAKLQRDTLRNLAVKWASLQRNIYLAELHSITRWNRIRDAAITVATAVRDAPKAVVSAAGSVASSVAVAGVSAFLPALLIVGAGIVLFVSTRRYIAKG